MSQGARWPQAVNVHYSSVTVISMSSRLGLFVSVLHRCSVIRTLSHVAPTSCSDGWHDVFGEGPL